jgi:hypothetical protein
MIHIKKLYTSLAVLSFTLWNAQSVDLAAHVSSTPPSGAVLEWHSSSTPSSATKLSSTTVSASSTPSNYWVFYYDSTNNCYSPGAKVTVLGNLCPSAVANLNNITVSMAPSGSVLEWHTSATPTAGNKVPDPSSVNSGTYWATYFDSTNNCYSPTSTPVIVETTACSGLCYKPAVTTGVSLETKYGITALGRAGNPNGNWPMVRKGGWMALEAKTKGMVINRIPTTAQVNALNPVEGMIVYDIQAQCLKVYTSTDGGSTFSWQCINTQTCPD